MRRSEVLAGPFVVGLVLLIGFPLVTAGILSFTDYSGIGGIHFTGLDNLSRLGSDEGLRRALGNTALFTVMSVPLRVGAMLGLALLLHSRFRFASASRPAVYLPSVVPEVAYALLWLWLLNPIYGPLAAILGAAGVGSPRWLTDPGSARIAMVLMGLFQIGEGFVIALAARRMLPEKLFEAARVDGASAWFTFRKLTLPLMVPVLLLLTLRDVVLSLQINFVPALLVTGGGPRYATTFMPLFVYEQAFKYFRLGYASAVSLIMFLFTVVAVWAVYRVARRAGLV